MLDALKSDCCRIEDRAERGPFGPLTRFIARARTASLDLVSCRFPLSGKQRKREGICEELEEG